MNKTLVSVVGPTALGKTPLGIWLAQELRCEIISSDSRQFYREMNIGTAKPTNEELEQVKHHFVNSLSVEESYSVGNFEKDALEKIKELHKTHDHVIMVGGSGLYTDAVCKGLDKLPKGDDEIRRELQERLVNNGIQDLLNELKTLDHDYYNEVDKSNPHRVMRAIEVGRVSDLPFSILRKNKEANRPFNIIKIGIDIEREELYQRINKRVDNMIELGLVEEAKSLYPKKNLNALQTVGYNELFEHFEGNLSLEEAIDKIKQHTRNFAKRQLTWFRKDKTITWFNPQDREAILKHIKSVA